MSIPSILDVLAYIKSHGELTKGERLTLIAIANYADHADAQAYPSLKKLQEFTALTRRGQQMVLRRLENSKVIETRRNPRLRSSTYRLCIPRNDSSKSRRELTSQVLNAPANSLRGGGELTSPQPVIDLEERKDAREMIGCP